MYGVERLIERRESLRIHFQKHCFENCRNASFEPGGWLEDPALSTSPLLDLSIRPRTNLYLNGTDSYASFLVDAPISYITGKPFTNTSFDKNTNITNPFLLLFIDISVEESGLDLVSNKNVSVNSTNNEFVFSLKDLTARFDPYNITITGVSQDGQHSYLASTQLFYLPARTDGGSVTKLDNLYGGLLVQDYTVNSTAWTPLFPYSFYVSWDGWLELSLDNLDLFKAAGYNIIHIVPNAGLANEAFVWDTLNPFLDKMDEIGLWLMFDMRWTYTNLTSVQEQVDIINARKSMLLWYTGDEPDGHMDALNATKVTYNLIKKTDPWHPISVCLNCLNFYYEEYSAGADIILSDVYPIAVNTSWSLPYDTACNTTYGCCGCDDCGGTFEDVPKRFDLYNHYQEILGLPTKTQWGVPQAFGNETFWSRYPIPDEEVVMAMLSINHAAKGIVAWAYPTVPDLEDVTSKLAKVITVAPASGFLLGSETTMNLPTSGVSRVDVSSWTVGGQMLVSVVNMDYQNSLANVSITLPESVKGLNSALWGEGNWTVAGNTLLKVGLAGLEVDLLVFDI